MYAKITATEHHLIELQNIQHQHYHSINQRLGVLGSNMRRMALQPARHVASSNHGREEQKDGEERV
eukprot:13420542-Ditylum_brightwellii.AAC.1